MQLIQTDITIKLLTPAFLGNAHQMAEWRSPPLKALMREWWRIAVAEKYDYKLQAIRQAEDTLFGSATESGNKSKISMRLNKRECVSQAKINQKSSPNEKKLDYLAYGRIGNGTSNSWLDISEAYLSLRFPSEYQAELDHTFNLIHYFGTIGGRCRNGWGSLHLQEYSNSSDIATMRTPSRPLGDCLQENWAHAFATDAIWESTKAFTKWEDAMNFLAQLRKELLQIDKTHRLYFNSPVKNKNPGGAQRYPTQLRQKLIQTKDDNLKAFIYHIPTKYPGSTQYIEEEQYWKNIYARLNDKNNLFKCLKNKHHA